MQVQRLVVQKSNPEIASRSLLEFDPKEKHWIGTGLLCGGIFDPRDREITKGDQI